MKPDLLYLVHRIPYPPNKGDKVRSYHILQYLITHFNVHLGTFIDHPDDWQHTPALEKICASVHVCGIHKWQRNWRCLRSMLNPARHKKLPLSVVTYQDATMQAWVDQTIADKNIQSIVLFSAAMAQFVEHSTLPTILDMVDVDSEKWASYANDHRWPFSWLYQREAQLLNRFEANATRLAQHTLLSTPAEVNLFKQTVLKEIHQAPDHDATHHPSDESVLPMQNGVDSTFFSPTIAAQQENPYLAHRAKAQSVLVFTGAMDYWPNMDGVTWFSQEILPLIRQEHANCVFYIVGSNPTPSIRALHDGQQIFVTGTVPDVRPYLHYADLAVVPLRIARGIQNKLLEALAMSKAVVVTEHCARAMADQTETLPLRTAHTEREFSQACLALLQHSSGPAAAAQQRAALGTTARQHVQNQYTWQAQLACLDTLLLAKECENSSQ